MLPSVAALGQVPATRPGGAAAPAATRPATLPADPLKGRLIEDVRIVGNNTVTNATIRNLIRSHEGEKFDPATVEEDYQRIFGLRKFANVEPRVQPTATGVIITFQVTEQRQIQNIVFRGNATVEDSILREAIEVKPGESIDRFRINLARQNIERLYRERNHPFAHVTVDDASMTRGEVVFNVTEGPNVRVRKVEVLGNTSFSAGKIKDQVKTTSWIFIFRAGTFDPEQIDDDVAAIRKFYEEHGFFDVRVGRKLTWSPDQTEVMVSFVVDEGTRYQIEKIVFRGNSAVSEAQLRQGLRLTEGRFYDADGLRRDVRQIVRAYSPLGYIYQPTETDPEKLRHYLQVKPETVIQREAGRINLVYDISEGRPFSIGRIRVRGNERIQDKVFLREMRVAPGQLYNSGEIQDAQDRIRGTRLVSNVTITPIGDAENSRDLLVEVEESQTAFFMVGAGLTSSAGLLGNISYEQRNFDITNVPSSWSEAFSKRAFTGAGQYFRILLEPGTEQSRARITFEEPWIFDQPYSFRTDLYYSTRQREDWDETRTGASFTLGHRFSPQLSARVSVRGEDVEITNIDDPFHRAPEIVALEGHSTLTSASLAVRWDTTDNRVLPSRGTVADFSYEYAGAFGGDFHFHKFQLGWNYYQTVSEDLLDRKTILVYRADAGYITGDVPFFERYYAGGIGSMRGFKYRGISPRSGADRDPIGGNFILTGTVELNFPIPGVDMLRGVVFADAGTVESDFKLGTIRTAVGFGIRLTLPIFGQVPLAVDFGVPITKDDDDDPRIISFSLGYTQ